MIESALSYRWNFSRLMLLPTLIFLSITLSKGQCSLFSENGAFAPEISPVLEGKAFRVPDMKFRFQRDKQIMNAPQRVDIFYMWQWLGRPDSENPRGAWNEAGDIVECKSNGERDLLIPSFEVVPKGWYSGEFANEKGLNLPFFDHLEVSFVTKDCGTPRIIFNKSEIIKFQRSVALVSLPCGGLAKVKFVSK